MPADFAKLPPTEKARLADIRNRPEGTITALRQALHHAQEGQIECLQRDLKLAGVDYRN